MKDKEVLDLANEAEAEMAAIAYQCLVTALDHSKAEHIEIILDLGEEGNAGRATPVLRLPPRALRFFADVLRQMVKREPMLLVPQKHELTTQEAANFLNVSRPFVIKNSKRADSNAAKSTVTAALSLKSCVVTRPNSNKGQARRCKT